MKTSNPKPRAWVAWAPPMVADLVTMWRAGSKSWEIAKQLGLTKQAVRSKVSHLRKEGVDLDRRAMPKQLRHQPYHRQAATSGAAVRKCLTCGDDFASTHKGNRRCGGCFKHRHYQGAAI